jgi:hypothetical protein
MVTENTAEQRDELTQDQDAIDTQQGIDGAADQPLTRADLEAFKVEQNSAMQGMIGQISGQVGGLHSGFNKALDTMRRETNDARLQDAQMAMTQEFQRYVDDLPEEQRTGAKSLWERQVQMNQHSVQQATQPVTQQPAQTSVMREVEDWVRDFGLDPKDPNIDYGALTDPNIPDGQRRSRFASSLGKAVAATVPQRTPASPRAPSPPTESEGVKASASLGSMEEVSDAYLKGNLGHEEYRTRMASYGQSV